MADDLLQQFQSITTSDHDELVDQFAYLLQLDVQTATFFLESCNWNVETAANNYLATMETTSSPRTNPMDGIDVADDLDMEDEEPQPSQKQPNSALFHAQFVSDLSASQNVLFAPDTPVQMQWTFVNTGTTSWPDDTRLLFIHGTSLQGPEHTAVIASPGQRIDLHVSLCMPSEAGSYTGSWRLHCSSGFFGDPVWVVVNVGTHDTAAFALQQPPQVADPSKLQVANNDRQSSSALVEDMDL
ncbi:hypothetical protein CCR75_004844 [Bremia lactucae]|uniref:Nbr1 FW domain-containing protein n=1 Tax=Bremia lactucae TaxID=4779 RepID=A0A976FI06_BRELC|nr:hypothetical protein CCR75_004844 [Bremia lactucae]